MEGTVLNLGTKGLTRLAIGINEASSLPLRIYSGCG